jgi:L-ascorbate metabolism protein UlaG (beta-lactamase superfamily)
VPLGDARLLHEKGIKNVAELDWWDHHALSIPEAEVVMMPTQHFSARGLWDRNETLWGGYLIRFHGEQIYFGGDSAYSVHFTETYKRFGAVDLAFLPIGAYEPRWFMSAMHMNPDEAVRAHLDLHSRQTIGIHFGTFHMSDEAINAPIEDLQKALPVHQVTPQAFRTLGEGQTEIFTLAPPTVQGH